MKPIAERLASKTDKRGPNECWPWLGWRHPFGHGQIGRGRRSDGIAYAHVVAWEIANEAIVPKGLCVCHKCDVPYCVNPAHLFLGTKKDNTADMLSKSRHLHGEDAPWAKLSSDDIMTAVKMRGEGLTQREIATHLGVSRSLIGMILQGKRWSHLAVANT